MIMESICSCFSINSLAFSRSFFAHKEIYKRTCRSPDGKVRNETVYVCISQRWKIPFNEVRVYEGADVASDDDSVRAMMRLRLKKLKKIDNVQSFAIEKLKDLKSDEAYQLELRNRFQVLDEVGADVEG